jgi:hypothetical protein
MAKYQYIIEKYFMGGDDHNQTKTDVEESLNDKGHGGWNLIGFFQLSTFLICIFSKVIA